MAIVQKQTPPASAPSAISRALGDLRGTHSSVMALGGAKVDLSHPLAVYRLGIDDLMDGPDGIKKAAHVGWRYLVEGLAGGGTGYADVKEIGGKATFSSLSQNPNAERLLLAAHLAEKLTESLPGDFEARILDVPGLSTSAIWLAGNRWIFIPYISPTIAQQKAKVEAAPQFLKDIVEAARLLGRQIPLRDPA